MKMSAKRRGMFKLYISRDPERACEKRLGGKTVKQRAVGWIAWFRRQQGFAHGKLVICHHLGGYAFFHNGGRLFVVGGKWQKAAPVVQIEQIDEDYLYDQ